MIWCATRAYVLSMLELKIFKSQIYSMAALKIWASGASTPPLLHPLRRGMRTGKAINWMKIWISDNYQRLPQNWIMNSRNHHAPWLSQSDLLTRPSPYPLRFSDTWSWLMNQCQRWFSGWRTMEKSTWSARENFIFLHDILW